VCSINSSETIAGINVEMKPEQNKIILKVETENF
jgi:hypothetical protein